MMSFTRNLNYKNKFPLKCFGDENKVSTLISKVFLKDEEEWNKAEKYCLSKFEFLRIKGNIETFKLKF